MSNKKKNAYQPQQLTGHMKLERRRLLNADFGFAAGELELTSFVDSDSSTPSAISIEQLTGTDTYEVILSEGVFTGVDVAGIATGDGTDTLLLDNSMGAITSKILAVSSS